MPDHSTLSRRVGQLSIRLPVLPKEGARLEELMRELKQQYTIIIVTHNMQQAARVSDMTAFFNAEEAETGNRFGYLVEYNKTPSIFENPQQEATKNYVSGRFG